MSEVFENMLDNKNKNNNIIKIDISSDKLIPILQKYDPYNTEVPKVLDKFDISILRFIYLFDLIEYKNNFLKLINLEDLVINLIEMEKLDATYIKTRITNLTYNDVTKTINACVGLTKEKNIEIINCMIRHSKFDFAFILICWTIKDFTGYMDCFNKAVNFHKSAHFLYYQISNTNDLNTLLIYQHILQSFLMETEGGQRIRAYLYLEVINMLRKR